jgi:hypothetical protein
MWHMRQSLLGAKRSRQPDRSAEELAAFVLAPYYSPWYFLSRTEYNRNKPFLPHTPLFIGNARFFPTLFPVYERRFAAL